MAAEKPRTTRQSTKEILIEWLKQFAMDHPVLFLILDEIIRLDGEIDDFTSNVLHNETCILIAEGMVRLIMSGSSKGDKADVNPSILKVWSEVVQGTGLDATLEVEENENEPEEEEH